MLRHSRKHTQVLGIPAGSVHEEASQVRFWTRCPLPSIEKYYFSRSRCTTYEETPVGKNTLSVMVKQICAEAGVGKKTNHSLRASGASAMFEAHVPEKIIQKTTGHRSLEALCTYERVSTDQHQAVSKVLMANASFETGDGQRERSKVQVVTHRSGGAENMARVFGDITNCTIGSITVHVNPTITVYSSDIEKEFDEVVASADNTEF